MRAKYPKKKTLPLMSPARQRQMAVAAAIMPNVADAGSDQHISKERNEAVSKEKRALGCFPERDGAG